MHADYLSKALCFNKRAIARLITLLENQMPGAQEVYEHIYQKDHKSRLIGITGPPGAGKSSTVTVLAKEIRKKGFTVGIIAVDPSSPFTGGALLGDRIRMNELSTDPGIFIRSMSSRGALGGIATSAYAVSRVLEYAGCDYILIETVGVGQSETEIAGIADVVMVVMVPNTGDDIQALKAGLMEIGDIFAVNKFDIPGADLTLVQLKKNFEMARKEIPVLGVSAAMNQGIGELLDQMDRTFETFHQSGELQRRRKESYKNELKGFVLRALSVIVENSVKHGIGGVQVIEEAHGQGMDPYNASKLMIQKLGIKEENQ